MRIMTVLEDCPDEILLDIISRVHRSEQLAGLSLACKRLRGLVASRLHDCKLFRHLDLACMPRLSCFPFRTILKRPELCSFVQKVRLSSSSIYSEMREIDRLSEAEEKELFESAVGDLGVLEWNVWKKMVDKFNYDGVISRGILLGIALLRMHPNLEKLSIELGNQDHFLCCGWVLWAFISSNPLSSLINLNRFHVLREVSFSARDTEYGCELDLVATFLRLPSITKLSGHKVKKRGQLRWGNGDYVSTVTELNFFSSCISLQAFQVLLRIPKALNIFYYDYARLHYGNEGFNHDGILAVAKEAQGLDEESQFGNLDVVYCSRRLPSRLTEID